jgi:pimeloyl-ACP methyl ester carboxylesterase
MIPTPHRRALVPYVLRDASLCMAVHEWGDVDNPRVLVCVHGLSRNGRDFDVIARALSTSYRVLCPDMPGRGESDWLPHAEDYGMPFYVSAMHALFAHYRVGAYDWIGTSMGGLIGMVLASHPQSVMHRMVLNDVGPTIERAALERIERYMAGKPPHFASYEALFAAAQVAIAPFGPLTAEQRHHIIRSSCRQLETGQWCFNTDPKIGEAFVAALKAPEVDLWPIWAASQRPTLILRGQHSDLLSSATVARMCESNRNAVAHEVADTGHAPMLMDVGTIERVITFLGA